MGLKAYLPVAIAVFLAATIGADVIARTSIAGEAYGPAVRDHLYYAGTQPIGTLLLLAPFVAVAFISAHAERRASIRSVAILFAVSMGALLYFYVQGYLGAQQALAEKKWTAAALSIGLLPFFVGIPVILVSIGASAIAVRWDRRMSD